MDEKMIKAWANKFLNYMEDINNEADARNDKLGKIGEKFVREGIELSLWESGYNFDPNLNGNYTFDILPYFGANENNVGGIDFYLRIKDGNIVYHFLIEVKNWAHYKNISDDIFKDEILDRFKKQDSSHDKFWILTMNKRNVFHILERCNKEGIFIIPIEEHLTTTDYINEGILQYTMTKFIDEFSRLLEVLM